jgi:FAD/FMN-containing dehydrogenase
MPSRRRIGDRPEVIPTVQEEWAALTQAMWPWAREEMNANLLSAKRGATPAELRASYGHERYDRLAAIKKRYDPDNLFGVNHNIVPA